MFHPCNVNQWFRHLGLGGLAEHDSCPIQWSIGPAQHEMLLLPGNADEVLIIRHVRLLQNLDARMHCTCFTKHQGSSQLWLGMPAMINWRMDPQVPCDFGITLQLLEASALD